MQVADRAAFIFVNPLNGRIQSYRRKKSNKGAATPIEGFECNSKYLEELEPLPKCAQTSQLVFHILDIWVNHISSGSCIGGQRLLGLQVNRNFTSQVNIIMLA